MQEDNMILDLPNAKELVIKEATIEFKNVYFKYSESTQNAFNIQSHQTKDNLVANHTENKKNQEGDNTIEQEDSESDKSTNKANSVPEWILNNISFSIPAGSSCALVGASGSGKSTCIRLLYRFYDICEGEIMINGININSVTQKSLRKCMGIVPQDTVLFNNTLV